MDETVFTSAVEAVRGELTAYIRRLVVRHAVAEELMQETALRAWEHRLTAPPPPDFRPWLFRVANNLALDHLRKHGRFRETILSESQRAAEQSPAWAATTASLRGSPEMAAVAREHLTACFACVLRQFPPEQAASLLLVEVYGFTTQEAAGILGARFPQVKNWLQQTRRSMEGRYSRSCRLISKQGVCYQCVELDGMYEAGQGDPLAGTAGRLDDRLRIVRDLRDRPTSRWERLLAGLLDDLGA